MESNIQYDFSIFPESESVKIYIVGGTVRDLLLNRKPVDYDVVVSHEPDKYASKIAKKNNGRVVQLGKPSQILHRVISDHGLIDVTQMIGQTIQDDLQNRDFTVNAMAYELVSKEIIDPSGGRQDLEYKKVRMVSPSIFKNDPIRLIRAFRMAASMNFSIEPTTLKQVHKQGHLIVQSAGERVRLELIQILQTHYSHQYILMMCESGLLFHIFPELKDLKGCTQGSTHCYDVFDHTIKSYQYLENMLNNPEMIRVIHLDKEDLWNNPKRKALLKFAILLHDIGKFPARSENNKGRILFYGHGNKSSTLLKKISSRLRLSTKETNYIDLIIKNHIRALYLFVAYRQKKIGQSGLNRFFLKYDNHVPDILVHTIADIQGKGNPEDQRNKEFIEFAREMIHQYFSTFRILRIKPPLINGEDLINRFNIKPSPIFQSLLNRVEEARLSETIHTKKEAEALVRSLIAARKDHEI